MIVREDYGDIALVRMAHGKVSALDVPFCEMLVRELQDIATSSSQALVITGTGSAFSAGVDLFRLLEGGPAYVRRFLPLMEALFLELLTFPKPLVAAINGHAIAAGCVIACTGDHRLMADGTARIGVPELALGVPFPVLPFEIVAARVSPTALRGLVYSGRTVPPAEAKDLGLIDDIVEPQALLERARQTAAQLAGIPPQTFALTKRAFVAPVLENVRASARHNAEVVEAWLSPAVHAAIAQYLERTLGKKS